MNNKRHEANRNWWSTVRQSWKDEDDQDWDKCHKNPSLAFEGDMLEMIQKYAGDLNGKPVCVIGSGDNYAAFALSGMGARVTSTDITLENLDFACERAGKLGLSIEFIQCDATSMEPIPANGYDFVCSTNGFFVWISDLNKLFSEVCRILKPGGYYIFYDIHPFLRPWKDQLYKVEMEKSYYDTGPFRHDGDGWTTYNFHWTVSDILNALTGSGLVIRQIAETSAADSRFWQWGSIGRGTDPSLLDWHVNPLAGLPTWLTVVVQKPNM